MKVSLNWLIELVDIPHSSEEVATALTMAGLEVETIDTLGDNVSGIITGKIDAITPHPNADKLVITQISDGTQHYTIVTGANNIAVGDIVPVSLPGAILADGTQIKKAKLRGEPSYGMLCSEKELGIAEESNGIWVLPKETPVGVDFIKEAQIKDAILDIAILPNRGDCQSVIGVARELSVIYSTPLKMPSIEYTESELKSPISVSVEDPKRCPKYTGRIIQDIQTVETPLWMQRRLMSMGIRPISFIVDVTNYVLLETGQPLHAFGLSKLKDSKIIVRCAAPNEKMSTLDDIERTFQDQLLICNGDRPVALAGVMGGKNSDIDEGCDAIFLEAAYFDAVSIRRSAQSIGLRTESSIRFEKGADWEMVNWASHRVAALLQTYAKATIGALDDVSQKEADVAKDVHIPFDIAEINQLLSMSYTNHEAITVLESLGYIHQGDQLTVPSWRRQNIRIWQDIAEELGRTLGLDQVRTQLPQRFIQQPIPSAESSLIKTITNILKHQGFHQTVTFPMISPKDIELFDLEAPLSIRNPLSVEASVLRSIMAPSLLKVAEFNMNRQQDSFKLFEIGKVFPNTNDEWNEVAALVVGNPIHQPYTARAIEEKHTYASLKGLVEHLLETCQIQGVEFQASTVSWLHPIEQQAVSIDGSQVGVVGYFHPMMMKHVGIDDPIGYFHLRLADIVPHITEDPVFEPYSKFPHTRRDIALLVPKTMPYLEVETWIKKNMPKWCTKIALFDYFESEQLGKDHKGVAVALTYQDDSDTLQDNDVNQIHDTFCKALVSELPVTIR